MWWLTPVILPFRRHKTKGVTRRRGQLGFIVPGQLCLQSETLLDTHACTHETNIVRPC